MEKGLRSAGRTAACKPDSCCALFVFSLRTRDGGRAETLWFETYKNSEGEMAAIRRAWGTVSWSSSFFAVRGREACDRRRRSHGNPEHEPRLLPALASLTAPRLLRLSIYGKEISVFPTGSRAARSLRLAPFGFDSKLFSRHKPRSFL